MLRFKAEWNLVSLGEHSINDVVSMQIQDEHLNLASVPNADYPFLHSSRGEWRRVCGLTKWLPENHC
jgi:hypothetical protein